MDVKQAVATAKAHFNIVFADEEIGDPTLEEVWFDERRKVWCVTIGIRRDVPSRSLLEPFTRQSQIYYKTVRISDKDGKPLSIRNRDDVM